MTLGPEPVVSTVCGSGDLFGFDDRDGVGDAVLLQHPLGIAAGDGVLYVADSFNHNVKRVDPRARECRTPPIVACDLETDTRRVSFGA